jgi:cyclopropane-fatty-acyl-phospholipid synthase
MLKEYRGHFRAVSTRKQRISAHSPITSGTLRKKVEHLLSIADVEINGSRPWDLQVHNNKFYHRVLASGSLGLGESYVDGWWDCNSLDEFFHKILRANLGPKVKSWTEFIDSFRATLLNLQNPSRAFHVGQHHYDIGNDLYEKMLGKRLIYSCGYWKDASTLDAAQEAKLDLCCRKLAIEPGMRVLDIGCGWGDTAKFIAERYKAEVVGITVSKEQARFAENRCQGLPVEIKLQDYRELQGKYDRILSIGMFEHVGYKNYSRFMQVVRNRLQSDGLFLLHTIGNNHSVNSIDPWINKYIFPNAMLPSKRQICNAVEGGFVLEDWHNFGADYDRTLMYWFKNFHTSWHILKQRYDSRFYRMWKYYLLACAGSFRARCHQVWQLVLSPRGVPGGYRAPR